MGKGTSVVIYLPVYSNPAESPAVKSKAPEKKSEIWGTGTILLVEDEDMVRSVAERALSRQGYKVLTATDGEEALEVLARGESIDLMISDVVMPNMDGPTIDRKSTRLNSVTNAHLVCRLLLETKKTHMKKQHLARTHT